ncbi:MAG: N-acetyl-gamma-glutamyl-phosphate reductase [Firmicutes bacterium]|nr:N-acetyl-gamma-glutamyl-phosphate reductase [Bacillota bacterium]
MLKVAVVGATGYSGIELLRLLDNHPNVKICKVISGSTDGQMLADIYPHLTGHFSLSLENLDVVSLAKEVDLVFFATPSGVSSKYVPQLLEHGIKCIDLSGDFRLNKVEDFAPWYKHQPAAQKYLDQAVYGLSELFADQLSSAQLVANPGCYPTATLLALIPALQGKLIKPESIVIDGKSGVSGAGRGLSLTTHFSEVNENLKAYKLGVHQHIPEIQQLITKLSGEQVSVTFTTHLIPITRGMMCTIYADLQDPGITTETVVEYYQKYYHDQAFIRISPAGTQPVTKQVLGSNYCDLGFVVEPRTGKLIMISVIDNLTKGAAGQAVQNMNLVMGWPQTTGLINVPMYP